MEPLLETSSPRPQPLVAGNYADVHEPSCGERVPTGRRAVIHPAAAEPPLSPHQSMTTTKTPVLARYNRSMSPLPFPPTPSIFVRTFFFLPSDDSTMHMHARTHTQHTHTHTDLSS